VFVFADAHPDAYADPNSYSDAHPNADAYSNTHSNTHTCPERVRV